MKHLIRIGALAGVMALLAVGAVATASAHADLDHSDPADDAVLAASPANVTLTFIEEIQHTAGSYSIEVTNAAGASVTSGVATIGSDDMSLSIALKPNLPNGVYKVSWSNLSVDGDALTDKSFTVGAAAAAPTVPAAAPHTHDDTEMNDAHADENTPPTIGYIVLAINPQHDSGVSGRAELFPVDGGSQTRIDVYLSGMEPGTSHMTHVHNNLTCDEPPGSHAADLNNVVADSVGRGTSSSTVDVPFSTIANDRHIILSHVGANAQGDKTTISCGDIPAQPESHDAHAAIALPSTGTAGDNSNDFSVSAILAALVAAGTMIVAGGVAIASKRR